MKTEVVQAMSNEGNIEEAVAKLKARTARYAGAGDQPSPEAVAELAKAIHDIGDHLVDLHRRIRRIEESQEEWTTRGWLPPPGSDSPG
jgi:hypothetical protein